MEEVMEEVIKEFVEDGIDLEEEKKLYEEYLKRKEGGKDDKSK